MPALLLRMLDWVGRGLLFLTLLLLPVTSLPALSNRMGGALVAPPSVITLGAAVPVWLVLAFVRRYTLPRETLPWLIFASLVIASSFFALFIQLPPYRSYTPLQAESSALLTFAVAAVFYLFFSTWFRDQAQLTWAIRAINFSGILMLLWSFAQVFIIVFDQGSYPGFMVRVQSWVSTRSLEDQIYYMRVSGFAYEPSWLAHQLNMVYLPLWLGATVSGYSCFRKILSISLENVLLMAGVLIMAFTYSRIGLLGILIALAYGVVQATRYGIRRLRDWLVKHNWRASRWLGIALGGMFLLIYVLLVAGLLTVLARTDPRIARLLALEEIPVSLLDFAARVDFSERVLFWSNGWQVFARYPLLGVGLGNAGFFFGEHLPVVGLRSAEIVGVMHQALFLPNIKSFWIRLLAETGLLGTAVFASWYVLLWAASRTLAVNRSRLMRALGWMGSITLLTFLAEGFSIDSFALPYLWITLGLLTAASALARKPEEQEASGISR